jgi:hypothetical protein
VVVSKERAKFGLLKTPAELFRLLPHDEVTPARWCHVSSAGEGSVSGSVRDYGWLASWSFCPLAAGLALRPDPLFSIGTGTATLMPSTGSSTTSCAQCLG